jgi:hypothetical protein
MSSEGESAESFVARGQLNSGLQEVLPWEERFSDDGNLREDLREAGLEIHHREYTARMSVDDFLLTREMTFQARLMKEILEASRWESFRAQVRNDFHRRCDNLIEDTRDAYLAVGYKPAG